MAAEPRDRYPSDGERDGGHVVHQALRREVNERIQSSARDFQAAVPGSIAVMCECVHTSCTARIEMAVAEYEQVRPFPTRFFVKEGHEVAEDERVVAESAGYVVVEKSGRAGLYAVAADPRRRPRLRTAGMVST